MRVKKEKGAAATATAPIPDDPTEYRKLVRAEAIRLADEMGWCSSGLDEYLDRLGLPRKGAGQAVRVEAHLTRPVWVRVPWADSAEEARGAVTEQDVRAALGGGADSLVSFEAVEVPTPEHVRPGDEDYLYGQRMSVGVPACDTYFHARSITTGSARLGGGYYCSREPGHPGNHGSVYGRSFIATDTAEEN